MENFLEFNGDSLIAYFENRIKTIDNTYKSRQDKYGELSSNKHTEYEVAQWIYKRIIQTCPVDKGTLRDSIKIAKVHRHWAVFTLLDYAKYTHAGYNQYGEYKIKTDKNPLARKHFMIHSALETVSKFGPIVDLSWEVFPKGGIIVYINNLDYGFKLSERRDT